MLLVFPNLKLVMSTHFTWLLTEFAFGNCVNVSIALQTILTLSAEKTKKKKKVLLGDGILTNLTVPQTGFFEGVKT